ncbi:MAG: cobalt transporter CbiM [Arcobacter sp.]|nr:cobalt transporter CbiM [Arcobacter sp.]
MHISDGVLSVELASSLAVLSVGIVAYNLKKLKNEDIALVAAMSALFFIASFIHIPVGPTQIHLLLIGLIGVFLGSLSFISISIALFLQAILLGYGGLSSLGANILIMALPAYLTYIIFRLKFFSNMPSKLKFFLIGASGVFFSIVLLFLVLFFAKEEYAIMSYSILLLNIPAVILEGLISMFLLMYIKKSIPKLLEEAKI